MKFFLWFITIIIVLRMLGKLLRPFLFSVATDRLRKMQEQMNNNMNNSSAQTQAPPQVKTQSNRKEGDYIDYEEVR